MTYKKVLSVKIASAEIIKEKAEEWPIFLLDDVEAELDDDRVNNLREIIINYPGQVFLTGTTLTKNTGKNLKFLEVVDGIIKH